MGLMILAGAETSVVLTLLLFAAVGLAVWETREQKLDLQTSAWWVLLVLLVHVLGYLALRVWVWNRSRGET